MAYSAGILESDEGYFDFVKATKDIAQEEGVDVKKKIIIVFWTETNSIMMDKFKALKEEEDW